MARCSVYPATVSASVLELWRYPVKSLLGGEVGTAELEYRGIRGDRRFAITDGEGKLGSGKTTRRFRLMRGLFDLRAHQPGVVRVGDALTAID